MILVDTSVWIDFFTKPNSASAIFLETNLKDRNLLCINSVIEMEILQGIKNDRSYAKAKLFLTDFQYFHNFTKNYFETATEIYRECRKQGVTIRKSLDCIIAANCLIDGLKIAHKDRDFNFIGQVYTDLQIIRF